MWARLRSNPPVTGGSQRSQGRGGLYENQTRVALLFELVGRHRHVNRRISPNSHLLADRVIVRAVRLQVDVIAIRPIDDVVVRIAALTDQTISSKPDMHVAWDQLGPILEVGFEIVWKVWVSLSFTTRAASPSESREGTSFHDRPTCSNTRTGLCMT